MSDPLDALPAGPSADGEDRPFWEGLQRGTLTLPRCADCETWRPVGLATCANCWSLEVLWAPVPATGTVYSWMRTHRNFMSELDVAAPYLTALVELDDAPIRLLGIVIDAEQIAIGDRLTGVFTRPENSEWTVLRWVVA